MRDIFSWMLEFKDPPMVYAGRRTGIQAGQAGWHFGAFYRGRIHFDPDLLSLIATSSNARWQLVNTAMHEAAHALRHNHDASPVEAWFKGYKIPMYEAKDAYFADLNPGGQCMIP